MHRVRQVVTLAAAATRDDRKYTPLSFDLIRIAIDSVERRC
jgi:hypothetical protein